MRLTIRAAMTLILCLVTETAGAQFLKYTPPGGPEQTPESRKEEIDRDVEEARYHLGPVRVAPWASLRDIAYVRNLFASGPQPPNDLTATAGLGFRAYLRNGHKVTWTAQVLPEYVWWRREDQRRQLNGRYLLGFFGYFNRFTLEVRAGREQQQQIVTPEVPVPVSSRIDGGELLTEVELAHSLFAFAAVSLNQQHNLVEDLGDPRTSGLVLLDREERVTRAGLRLRQGRRWSAALGAEHSEAVFDHGTLDRSNSGTSPVAEVRFEGRHLGLQAGVAARSLEARRGAAFVPYDKVTGNVALLVGSGKRFGGTLYTSRDLVYSVSSSYAYLDDERVGLALTAGLGRHSQSRFFYETGSNTFTAFEAGVPRRRDDVSSYGASLTFSLRRSLSLGLQALRSNFNANVPGGDRTYTTVGTTLTLGGK